MEQKPSIGRIVIYKTTEAQRNEFKYNLTSGTYSNIQTELPAIIVAAWGPTTVNLQVFVDGHIKTMWVTSAIQGDTEGQWNWPKREE